MKQIWGNLGLSLINKFTLKPMIQIMSTKQAVEIIIGSSNKYESDLRFINKSLHCAVEIRVYL